MAVINTINETPDINPKFLRYIEPNSFFVLDNAGTEDLFFKPDQLTFGILGSSSIPKDASLVISIDKMKSLIMSNTSPVIPVKITNTPEIKYKEII